MELEGFCEVIEDSSGWEVGTRSTGLCLDSLGWGVLAYCCHGVIVDSHGGAVWVIVGQCGWVYMV